VTPRLRLRARANGRPPARTPVPGDEKAPDAATDLTYIPGDDQALSDLDQTLADADQSAADVEQTLSDADQVGAQRDQSAADHDQQAADLDQASSNRARELGSDPLVYEQTRRIRASSTLERDISSHARQSVTHARDESAEQRDRVAAARDLAAEARDGHAAALDAEVERLAREREPDGETGLSNGQILLRAARERQRAAQSRELSAAQRAAAAEDREHAARDRQQAALDRQAFALELAISEVDEVTGALRRGVGLAAIRREIDRSRRTGTRLAVVFIDVDGLKRVNDELGHSAGDELLRSVVHCVHQELRSYDLIVRFGGDEFVCSLSGDGLASIGERFSRIGAHLSDAMPGASISIGWSQCGLEDTVETLIDRADAAMIASRRKPPVQRTAP